MGQWDKDAEMKRKTTLAVIACIATLYISPISSVAPDLVKAHMATLIHIDDDRKKHLITYPSEPVLAEAALEVLSDNGVELGMLTELDAINKLSGILDAGSQGELVVRLLFLSAWRRLICSERNGVNKVCIKHFYSDHHLHCLIFVHLPCKISFSVRRPVLKFLEELFELELPEENFSYLKDFDVGFTHFIGLTEKPDKSTLNIIWNRRGAMQFKTNQKSSDFGLVIRHKVNKDLLGALVVQVSVITILQKVFRQKRKLICNT
jgi:hypothetical protein